MKKLLFVAMTFSLVAVSCKKEDASSRVQEGTSESVTTEPTTNTQTNEPVAAENTVATTVSFDKTEHSFGDLKKGSKGETEFVITNTGSQDLVLTDVKASCGCTAPEWPKQPIKPGQSDKIKVVFSANAVGMQNKTVTVSGNIEKGQEILKIKANVIE